MMAAVCAYCSEPKRTPTAFSTKDYTLDALVAVYNKLVCDPQSDPRAMQGRGHQRQVGRPRKGNVGKANLKTPQPAPAPYELTGPDEDIEDI